MNILVFTQTTEPSVTISFSFSKISIKLSPEQVDASNSLTKSSFSLKYYKLGLELMSASSYKSTSLTPLSPITSLPWTIVMLSESVVSFSSFYSSFFSFFSSFYQLNLPLSQQGKCNMGILLLPYPRYHDWFLFSYI